MSRYYTINDKKLPSVTTIISDCTNNSAPLTQWAANMAIEYLKDWCEKTENICKIKDKIYYDAIDETLLNEARFNFRKVSKKALDIGSEVHDYIENYLKTGNDLYKPKFKESSKAIRAFHDWEEEHNLMPISLEQTVYSDRWAGTLDFYGYFNDKLYVIDWKSSKAHYPEMRYQVAAYRNGIDENAGDCFKEKKIKGCGVLRLDKETGMPDWKDTSKTYEQDLEVFNKMVDLFYARHPRISKKVKGK